MKVPDLRLSMDSAVSLCKQRITNIDNMCEYQTKISTTCNRHAHMYRAYQPRVRLLFFLIKFPFCPGSTQIRSFNFSLASSFVAPSAFQVI